MKQKLNYGRTFLIGMAFMSISAFWQVYDNIIPLILKNTFGMGETVTGVVMALDNVLALVLLPVFGTLSDKVDTKLGKRTPFIIVGTTLAVSFMMMLPFADKLEKACIKTVEDGKMTKSLSLISTCENPVILNSLDFIKAIRETLDTL